MLKKFYHPKLYIGIIVAALVVTGVYFWLCRLAGEHAAEIFNAEMARQKTLEGSVAVESITADMWGNVGFRGLKWLDAEGEPVGFVANFYANRLYLCRMGVLKLNRGMLLPEV